MIRLSKEEQKQLSEKLRSCNLRTFQGPNDLVIGEYSLNGVSYGNILSMARIINEAKPKRTAREEIENEVLTVADAIKEVTEKCLNN